MADLHPQTPLKALLREWSQGILREKTQGEIVSLAIARNSLGNGFNAEFSDQFKSVFGGLPPQPGRRTDFKKGFVIWMGQGQYFVFLPDRDERADQTLSHAMNGTAYSTLQTDGWACLELQSTRATDILERFIPLNLRQASAGFATRTSAHHLAVIVMKISEAEFHLLTPRSSAHSFVESLSQTIEHVLQ